jgi:hypothetical protein
MLTGTNTSIKKGGDFEPIPTDKYIVVIADVNQVQRQKYHSTEMEDKLNFQFTVLSDKPMPEKPGKPASSTKGRFLWHAMTKSLGARSWLLKLAKAAYGRDLTEAEFDKFETDGENMTNSLVGKQVEVMVEAAPNADHTAVYNNILAYSPCLKPLPIPEDVKIGPKEQVILESVATPAVAPAETSDPEKFIATMKAAEDSAAKPAEVVETPDAAAEEAEAELKLAEAKLKVAKAKAAAAVKK